MSVEVRRFLRANLSAILATGLEWCLITVLVAMSVNYLVAAAIGAFLGAVTDFTIKRHWAFARAKAGGLHGEAVRYVAASASSLGWNVLLAYTFVDRLHMMKVPGVIAASVAIGILWNYPIHRYFVFPDRGPLAVGAASL